MYRFIELFDVERNECKILYNTQFQIFYHDYLLLCKSQTDVITLNGFNIIVSGYSNVKYFSQCLLTKELFAVCSCNI